MCQEKYFKNNLILHWFIKLDSYLFIYFKLIDIKLSIQFFYNNDLTIQ